ncbi:unnamed protein product [Rotaria magnacalcarata]
MPRDRELRVGSVDIETLTDMTQFRNCLMCTHVMNPKNNISACGAILTAKTLKTVAMTDYECFNRQFELR